MRGFGGCHRVIEKEIGAVEERSGEKGVGVKKDGGYRMPEV